MEAFNDGRKCFVHYRTIVFIQTDLLSIFSSTRNKPTAQIWEQEVVACNQIAKSFGVFEGMPLSTAMTICPELTFMNSSDHLLECKTNVDRVTKILYNYAPYVERLGLDQCFIDLSSHPAVQNPSDAHVDCRSGCACGCRIRLNAGRRLAAELQASLQTNLNASSRIGVSYSKTLARLAAERSAVGECVLVFPEEVSELLPTASARLIFPVAVIPQLLQKEIRTIKQVRDMNFEELKIMVGTGCAVHVRNAASGIDPSAVVPCDRWLRFSVECEIREKFRILLLRLLSLTEEHSKTPLAIKVSVRKFDPLKNSNFKDAKTGQIPCGSAPTLGRASPECVTKLLSIIMSLFNRIIDVSRSFHLSLLGLSFVRFEERSSVRSVASCLLRKRDLSVQTVVSISSVGESSYTPNHSRDATPEPPEFSDEPGPSEKKAKLDIVIKKRKFHEEVDLCSPSKLRVGDLNLNCDDVPNKIWLSC